MGYPGEEKVNAETDARTNVPHPPSGPVVESYDDLMALRRHWDRLSRVPTVKLSRDEGRDVSFGGIDIRQLLCGDDSAGSFCFHNMIVPPGGTIPAHRVRDGISCWWILQGAARIGIGASDVLVEEGAFLFAPAGMTQSVANQTAAPLELIVAHSPAGLDRAFAAAHAEAQPDRGLRDFAALLDKHGLTFTDGATLPQDDRVNMPYARLDMPCENEADYRRLRGHWSTLAPMGKVVHTLDEARKINISEDGVFLLAAPEETGGTVSAFMNVVSDGWRTGEHHQPEEDEMFIVFDGPLLMRVGNASAASAQRGAFAYAPRFATHSFGGPEAGKRIAIFSLNAPAGHDRGFELAERLGKGPELFARISTYGFHFHV